jgi:hypothetical protein
MRSGRLAVWSFLAALVAGAVTVLLMTAVTVAREPHPVPTAPTPA